jgi:hypothetical protein
MIAGNVSYSLSGFGATKADSSTVGVAMILAARFTVGFSAGSYAVVQSYLSYATKPSQVCSHVSREVSLTIEC